MFEWLADLIKGTVEWREWGWNIPTIGAVGALCFSSLQGVGLWKQGARIWRDQAAPTVSVPLFTYSMWYFFAFIVYGIQGASITVTLAGTLGFLHIRIIRGVARFEGLKSRERTFLWIAPLMVPIMFSAPEWGIREELLMVYLFGVLGFLIPQAYRAWKSPAPKDLDPSFMTMFLLAGAFWFIYAFALDSWALQIFNPLVVIIWSFMLTMWWKKVRVRKV